MSLFRLTVIGLGIVVIAITAIGAAATSATARGGRHRAPAASPRTHPPPAQRVSARAASAADSEWATAAHVAW